MSSHDSDASARGGSSKPALEGLRRLCSSSTRSVLATKAGSACLTC